jgi:hypothetical protein
MYMLLQCNGIRISSNSNPAAMAASRAGGLTTGEAYMSSSDYIKRCISQ